MLPQGANTLSNAFNLSAVVVSCKSQNIWSHSATNRSNKMFRFKGTEAHTFCTVYLFSFRFLGHVFCFVLIKITWIILPSHLIVQMFCIVLNRLSKITKNMMEFLIRLSPIEKQQPTSIIFISCFQLNQSSKACPGGKQGRTFYIFQTCFWHSNKKW